MTHMTDVTASTGGRHQQPQGRVMRSMHMPPKCPEYIQDSKQKNCIQMTAPCYLGKHDWQSHKIL